MQRKYGFLWLALVPLGAAGALATGMIALPWQISSDNLGADQSAQSMKAAGSAEKTSSGAQTKSSKLAALDKQTKPAKASLTEAPANADLPSLSTRKKGKFGIDIARISPEGSSVIAGYAAPGKSFTVMADGKPIGVVTPDQSGDWVLVTPHKFASLDPKISLEPGDHTAKTVAALEPRSSANTKVDAQPASAKLTASEVTRQMMRRLEKLTRETAQKPASQPLAPKAKAAPGKVARERRLALATRPSRLGGPVTEKPAAKPALPSMSQPIRRTDERKIATGPAPTLPSALSASNAKSRADAKPVALTETLPVPVQFVYRKDIFTARGREAATLLLKYFKAKQFSSVVLSGHADERGTPSANFKLSKQRLARIRQFLRKGGYDGGLKLVPKGETEKFTGVDRSKFSTEELYQLDRRVEVMSAR